MHRPSDSDDEDTDDQRPPEVIPGKAVQQADRPELEYRLDGPRFDITEFKCYELLGKGAQGEVFRAENIIHGSSALKKMAVVNKLGNGDTRDQYIASYQDLQEQHQAVQRITDAKREFVTVSKVSHHENIVEFRGYLTKSENVDPLGNVTLFIGLIFEYMGGGTLAKMIEKNKDALTYDRILDYSIGIARALTFLHEKLNIIHRHIDSANIFLTSDLSVAKLGDFGYARDENQTLKTAKKGSIKYMAPEVIGENEVACYDFKSEVWSFSMLLYTMLVKREPSIENNGEEVTNPRLVKKMLTNGTRPNIDKFYSDNFPALVKLIQDGWQTDPKKRPTMMTMLETLIEIKEQRRPIASR